MGGPGSCRSALPAGLRREGAGQRDPSGISPVHMSMPTLRLGRAAGGAAYPPDPRTNQPPQKSRTPHAEGWRRVRGSGHRLAIPRDASDGPPAGPVPGLGQPGIRSPMKEMWVVIVETRMRAGRMPGPCLATERISTPPGRAAGDIAPGSRERHSRGQLHEATLGPARILCPCGTVRALPSARCRGPKDG